MRKVQPLLLPLAKWDRTLQTLHSYPEESTTTELRILIALAIEKKPIEEKGLKASGMPNLGGWESGHVARLLIKVNTQEDLL